MDKKKFDKIMDEWAAHEMEAAPDLKPRPEVYQKLEEKQKKTRFVLFSWPVRLAAAGIAAALIALVIILQPPKEVEPFLGLRKGGVAEPEAKVEVEDRMQVLAEAEEEVQEEEAVKGEKVKMQERGEEGLKEEKVEKTEHEEQPAKLKIAQKMEKAKEADKEVVERPQEAIARPKVEVEPDVKDVQNEAKRARFVAVAPAASKQILAERMELQYQLKGSEVIKNLDMATPQDEMMFFSSEDNYRLVLQLPQERYVYVFQVGSAEQLIRLFPNKEYNPEQNPLQSGKTLIIPSPPNWFYVEKEAGEVLIYVVTSAGPLLAWDKLYAEYSQTSGMKNKQEISEKLLDRIEQDKKSLGDQVSIRVFKFKGINS